MARGRRRTEKLKRKTTDERSAGLSHPALVLLGTLSTVVAIATGMFTLRDNIFPKEVGSAQASIAAYQQSVGNVCRQHNDSEHARAANARRLKRRLQGAK